MRAKLPLQFANCRYFGGLTEPEIQTIVEAASRRRYFARSVIVHEGQPAAHFYMLVTGTARHFSISQDGRKAFLFWVSPGEIFGASALLPNPSVYVVNTETVTDSFVLTWSRDTMRSLAAAHPRLWENGLEIARDYLAWYAASHLSLMSLGARRRVAQVLSSLAREIGQRTDQGFSLSITNDELASAANVTPYTASRFMSAWHKKGAIVKGRGRVTVASPEKLF